MEDDKFIYCLEAVRDIEKEITTEVYRNLEKLAVEQGIDSIYKVCDTIEGMEESLNALLYDDHNFKNYEIIYLVMQGKENNICLNGYYYSMEEIAELFEGKMKGKILHFANAKILDLNDEEAQYFLDITGARAISGYGVMHPTITSSNLDRIFFSLFEEDDNLIDIVETLHEKQYALCKLLDFRLYY
ncbi:DUF6642 family protein [Flavobacterium cerinum]|uniref:Uncharacterized protein n=1 Tax=Flavobacterium cerinum TaxID=2502784 RepID=A0ABY5ITJ8_9FLAO|nr:DUF6642 family protein [Flavobacterium cerinum]UUC44689.1 hypothetical protein NOX80_13745 [Flavobacterium cerinum]